MTAPTKVLVTGGAGFIASHLIPRLLAAGYAVRIMDNLSPQVHGDAAEAPRIPGAEFMRGSVTSREDWVRALAGVEQVFHLAAETGTGQSMYKVAHYNEVNSQGTALLFDVLSNAPDRTVRRVILTSSRSVYGEGAYLSPADPQTRVYPGARSADQLAAHHWEPLCAKSGAPLRPVPTREDDPVRPASIYAATKYAQEDLVRVGCESLGIGYVIFRLQNVYGEGQSLKNPYTGILSIFSNRIRRGLELPIFEDGLETRDFVHVGDVAEALCLGAQAAVPANSIINVGSGHATPVQEVAARLSEAFGQVPKLVITGEYRVGDIRHNFASIEALQAKLGFTPRISLAAGLARFAQWVLTQPLADDLLAKANRELMERNLMRRTDTPAS